MAVLQEVVTPKDELLLPAQAATWATLSLHLSRIGTPPDGLMLPAQTAAQEAWP